MSCPVHNRLKLNLNFRRRIKEEEMSKGTANGCGHPVFLETCHFLILNTFKNTSSYVGPQSCVHLRFSHKLQFG